MGSPLTGDVVSVVVDRHLVDAAFVGLVLDADGSVSVVDDHGHLFKAAGRGHLAGELPDGAGHFELQVERSEGVVGGLLLLSRRREKNRESDFVYGIRNLVGGLKVAVLADLKFYSNIFLFNRTYKVGCK